MPRKATKSSSLKSKNSPTILGGNFELHPNRDLHEQLVDHLVRDFTGKSADPNQKLLDIAKQKCREGDPFPLIGLCFPSLLITDELEAAYFIGKIGDPNNPCLRLDHWQRDIIAAAFDDAVAELFIKGNTKAGKGTSLGIIINLWFEVWPESKNILTSASFEHAQANIFGEVMKWRRQMEFRRPDTKELVDGVYDNDQRWIAVRNPDTGEAFSGQHGDRTLFVFDEASAVRGLLYDNAQKQFRKIIAASNPRTLSGWFRRGFPAADPDKTQRISSPFGKRACFTVGGADCMNVRHKRLEKPIAPLGGIEIGGRNYDEFEPIPPLVYKKVKPLIPGQCDYGRYLGLRAHPDKMHVAVFAHGKFPLEDAAKQVILDSWLERHVDAWVKAQESDSLPPIQAFGLDVARSISGDSTVLTGGGPGGVNFIQEWQYADTTFHVKKVFEIAEARGVHALLTRGRIPIAVDMDGLGAGVGDMLRAAGCWVVEFRGNATSTADPRRYVNLRADAYATFGRRLDPHDRWGEASRDSAPFCIPPDADLRQELTAPEKIFSDKDALRFKISPKRRKPGASGDEGAGTKEHEKSVEEKIGRSPDKGDSVVYLWHAVRVLCEYDAVLADYARPLVVSPAPGAAAANNDDGDGEGGHRDSLAPAAASAAAANGHGHANGQHKTTGESVIDWIKNRYGGRYR